MADVIANGVNLKNHFFEDNGPYVTTEPHTPESGIGTPSSHNTVTSPRVSRRNSTTAAEVCKNLVSFAQQLSAYVLLFPGAGIKANNISGVNVKLWKTLKFTAHERTRKQKKNFAEK